LIAVVVSADKTRKGPEIKIGLTNANIAKANLEAITVTTVGYEAMFIVVKNLWNMFIIFTNSQ